MAKTEKAPPPEPNPVVVAALQATNAFYNEGKLAAAAAEALKALAVEPNHFDANYSLGVIYRDVERLEEADAIFAKLSGREPLKQASVDNNRGILSDRRGEYEQAIEFYEAAIDREFQFAQAHLNLAFTLLRLERYEEGWKEHEWRWQTPQFNAVKCLQPRWSGQELDGTLLVHTEQGSGDTFQFLRYLPMVRERCKHVMLMVPAHLESIIQEGDWADETITPGNIPLDKFQSILPLMSAPYALGTKGDCLGGLAPYLKPQERSVDLGESHVPDAKLIVGICWGGSVTHNNNHFRSCSLEKWKPILEVPGVAFYSVQKGPQVAELASLGISSVRDTDPLQNDFADAASILQQMDLTITVDTSILHLAGSLGLKTWGLISGRCDWRWGLEGSGTDWYPSVQLHRQATHDDWDELVGRVAVELGKVVSGERKL